MKKMTLIIFTMIILLGGLLILTGCSEKENNVVTTTNNTGNVVTTKDNNNNTATSTNWPSTKFSKPENCEIVSVSDTFDGKQIVVKWASKDAFNNYIKALESMGEEKISGYEDDKQVVWNTMNIHLSYSELEENLNNILIYD